MARRGYTERAELTGLTQQVGRAAGAAMAGLVLAGGASSRMGQDKSCLPFAGQTLLLRAVTTLQRVCSTVVVSGRDPGPCGVEAPWLPDSVFDTDQSSAAGSIGPMGGIYTALEVLQCPLLVLACDMPCMDTPTLLHLIEQHGKRQPTVLMTTFQSRQTQQIQPLAAVYEPAALPLLNKAIQQKQYAIRAALPRHVRQHILYDEKQAGPFYNVNDPEDMDRLEGLQQQNG